MRTRPAGSGSTTSTGCAGPWLAGWPAYSAVKLENILFTRELARRTAGTGVGTWAFHPGFVATGFGGANPLIALGKRLALSPEQGAQPLVRLAAAPTVPAPSGQLLRPAHRAGPDRASRRTTPTSPGRCGRRARSAPACAGPTARRSEHHSRTSSLGRTRSASRPAEPTRPADVPGVGRAIGSPPWCWPCSVAACSSWGGRGGDRDPARRRRARARRADRARARLRRRDHDRRRDRRATPGCSTGSPRSPRGSAAAAARCSGCSSSSSRCVATVFLSLDTTAVLLTPVVVTLARRVGLSPHPVRDDDRLAREHRLAAAAGLEPHQPARRVRPGVRHRRYIARSLAARARRGAGAGRDPRRDLPAGARALATPRPRSAAIEDRLLFGIAAVVVALLVPALAIGDPVLHVPVWVPATVAAVVLAVAPQPGAGRASRCRCSRSRSCCSSAGCSSPSRRSGGSG